MKSSTSILSLIFTIQASVLFGQFNNKTDLQAENRLDNNGYPKIVFEEIKSNNTSDALGFTSLYNKFGVIPNNTESYKTDAVTPDLFFSEYIEGTSNNKAFEIYNPTSSAIDLSGYTVKMSNNGAGFGIWSGLGGGNPYNGGPDIRYVLTFPTGTMIAPGDVYVVYSSAAATGIVVAGDLALTYSGTINTGAGANVSSFNGNDALGLYKGTTLIDVFGSETIGTPVTSDSPTFNVAGVAAAGKDHTIVRKPIIHHGNTDWTSSAGTSTTNSEWIVYDVDNITFLGNHNMYPINSAPTLIVNTSTLNYTNTLINNNSVEKSFTVLGYGLTDNIIITAPTGFEISKGSGILFTPENTITLINSTGDLPETPIYVRFAPLIAQAYIDNITITSTGATENDIAVSGTGFMTVPAIGTITQPTCSVATGSVELMDLPSTGTWTLTRTPGGIITTGTGTSVTISGLATGTYSYTVTNQFGSTSGASGNVVINAQPEIPSVPTIGTITQPTCNVATGSVVINDLPALGTWTLTRTPGGIVTTGTGVSKTISGLTSGTYTYVVTISSGCTSSSSANVVINESPAIPTAPAIGPITQPTTTVNTGSVFLYGLPESGTWTMTQFPGGITTNGTGTGVTISGLASGTYTFTITNASGCTSVASNSVVINAQTTGINDNYSITSYLSQNYPNPFDQSTTIDFTLVKPNPVRLSVFNTLGSEVDVIVNETLPAGNYSKIWTPKGIPSGIYFYQLKIEGQKETKRLIKK